MKYLNPHHTDRTTGGLLAIKLTANMKTGQYVRIQKSNQHERIRFTIFLAALLLVARWSVNADRKSVV